MITARKLLREEIEQVWTIDRGEVIDHVYYFEDGTLLLRPEHHNMQGWPTGEAEKYTPLLVDCFDRGGWFYGIFDDDRLIGVAILEGQFMGKDRDRLQLKFLHVSKAYRHRGVGERLFRLARATAREKGAKRIYISATPSENTINFYLHLGCVVAREVDPGLFALEPEDIHLECEV